MLGMGATSLRMASRRAMSARIGAAASTRAARPRSCPAPAQPFALRLRAPLFAGGPHAVRAAPA